MRRLLSLQLFLFYMMTRWWIYLKEMFLPFSRLLFCILLSLSVASLVYKADGLLRSDFHWGWLLLGASTLFLFLLFYRIFDEFKDIDVDQKYFPERPLPSGRVSIRDLRILMGVAFFSMIILNLVWPWALPAFSVLLGFGILMRYNFFLTPLMAKNRILAFATHSPVGLLGNFYLIALFITGRGSSVFTKAHALIALWFFLPTALHEVARKTLPPSRELEGYQTYSQMLGYRGSAVLVMAFVAVQVALLPSMMTIGFSRLAAASYLVGVVVLLATCTAFIIRPEKVSERLRVAAETYSLAVLLLPAVEWFV